ncbi:MAG: S-adenosylmethionine:tRNA ribosyltransferase-isomerase, partial [Cytophagales bacterium]|nr:S-adenosylmethionine:tRNA ribosyltransferase-isomerase [Rhizobacter sp.]
GTTVTRALEHAASQSGLRSGMGVATQRITARSVLRVVDALISGTHEPGTSHHGLLQAFADAALLKRVDRTLESKGYRTHEFGDSLLIERAPARATKEAALQAETHAN